MIRWLPARLQLEERRTLNHQYSIILHTMNNQLLVPADTHLVSRNP